LCLFFVDVSLQSPPLLLCQVFHQHPMVEEVTAPDFFEEEAIASKVKEAESLGVQLPELT
jgi:hypothetical protein